jgi:ABC-type nitrate/sulfonate/bicarbonate transport system substrate-binding protein
MARACAVLVACFGLLGAPPARAVDSVTLQLKWKHQFQFGGYYAALEKGFYRDAGLDVQIREGGPDVDPAKALASGEPDFGVCTSSVLLDRANGRNIVVLAVIFQHSAAILLVPRRASIATVSELKGRRLMDTPGRAMT